MPAPNKKRYSRIHIAYLLMICTLKQSSSEVRKRQEVGRGLRLCVNQDGERMDANVLGNEVHNINILTVIASESYDSFAKGLQSEMAEAVRRRLPASVDVGIVDAAAREVMRNYDYNSYGGAFLLGCRKPIEKIHGAANERTIPYAVGQMRSMILAGMADRIAEQLDEMSRRDRT